MRLRQSALNTYKSCRRQYTFQYEMNLRPMYNGRRMPATGQRDAGSAAHAGAEVLHKGGTVEEARQAVTNYIEITRMFGADPEAQIPALPDDKEWYKMERLGHRMVEGYAEWRIPLDVGRTLLAVEEDWEFELPNGHVLFGKIDLAGHDPLIRGVMIEDLKTVNAIPSVHPANFQARTYSWAWWRITGEVPYGFRHRYMRRVLREGNRAKPPFYDVSEPLPMTEELLINHEKQLIVITNEIASTGGPSCKVPAYQSPDRYPNPTTECDWRCDFKGLCGTVDHGNDVEHVLDQHYVVSADDEREAPE